MKNTVQTRRQKARDILLKFTALLVLIVPLFFAVAALGSKFGLWSWQFGFGTLTRTVGPKLLFIFLGAGVLSMIAAFVIKPKRGIFIAILALALPVAGLGYAKSVGTKVRGLPFIHDISTDTQNAPVFTGKILAERAAVDGVNALEFSSKTDPVGKVLASVAQVKAYPDIRTVIRQEAPDVLYAKALETAKSLGWTIKDMNAEDGRIEATDTTFWFGFKDDVVIRVGKGTGGGSVLDIRSVSRVGQSDIGKNADRIREFLDAL